MVSSGDGSWDWGVVYGNEGRMGFIGGGSVEGTASVYSKCLGPGPAIFNIIIGRIYGQMDNYILIAVPMFILMAQLLSVYGITENLFSALRLMLARLRGALLPLTVSATTRLQRLDFASSTVCSLPTTDALETTLCKVGNGGAVPMSHAHACKRRPKGLTLA